MIAIKRILCPTDLTTESDEALRYAVALSFTYNAKLFVLYCKQTDTNRCRSPVILATVGSVLISALRRSAVLCVSAVYLFWPLFYRRVAEARREC